MKVIVPEYCRRVVFYSMGGGEQEFRPCPRPTMKKENRFQTSKKVRTIEKNEKKGSIIRPGKFGRETNQYAQIVKKWDKNVEVERWKRWKGGKRKVGRSKEPEPMQG